MIYQIKIIRNKNAVTRLTVNRDRITIKIATKDDCGNTVKFLTKVAADIQADQTIRVTMRGTLEGNKIRMVDDLRAISREYTNNGE